MKNVCYEGFWKENDDYHLFASNPSTKEKKKDRGKYTEPTNRESHRENEKEKIVSRGNFFTSNIITNNTKKNQEE